MDDYSYVVNDCEISRTAIGKFCSIAAMVCINPANHPNRASQHRFTYQCEPYFGIENDMTVLERPISMIGHDVWIGHGSIVLEGRNVGNGAVIGAGSVVTKNVDPYTVVAGNPARVLRKRFDPEVIDRLERLAWWDWSHEQLQEALPYFRKSAKEFVDRYA